MNSGASMPARRRCPRSSSAIVRHSGYMSVFVSTHATFGHTAIAWRRNSSSGAVYSWEASDTSSTASAAGSVAAVAAACTELSPPTPGVSTSTSPPASTARGSPISSWFSRSRLPGLPCSVA